jgi:hypothetical protein
MFTQTHKATVAVCEEINSWNPKLPLSLGGVHITNSFTNWEDSLSVLNDLNSVDLFFLYEAELSFRNFVRAVNKSTKSNDIQQVFFNNEDGIYFDQRDIPLEDDLNVLPAYNLMDVKDLSKHGTIGSFTCLKEKTPVSATVLSNRGCRAKLKWSDTSGHRVKTLKCHNEVRDDNRKANEKEIYRRLQA